MRFHGSCLARAGLHLGATTILRMFRERSGPLQPEPEEQRRRRETHEAEIPP